MEPLPGLVIAAQHGDRDAFAQLINRFQDLAYAYACAVVHDFHLAQDAAQEAFLEAFYALPQLREPAAFVPWLRRIVFKHADRLTRNKQIATVTLNTLHHLHDLTPDPADTLERQETGHLVRSAVATLPEHERIVTLLYYGSDYTQAQIAELLDLPLTTIKKRLHNARQRLRNDTHGLLEQLLITQRPSQHHHFSSTVQFLIAAMVGDCHTIQRLLQLEPQLITVREGWDVATTEDYPFPVAIAPGYTALHRAVHNRQYQLSKLLMSAGADVDARTRFGITPLHVAVCYRATELAQLLLNAGANPDLRLNNGMTALHWAVLGQSVDLTELLLKHGARHDIRDHGGRTACDWAILKGFSAQIVHGTGNYQQRRGSMTTHTKPLIPVGSPLFGRTLNLAGAPIDDQGPIAHALHLLVERPAPSIPSATPRLLETGIKVIDLFAPLTAGGIFRVVVPTSGIGKHVLLTELAQRWVTFYNGAIVVLARQEAQVEVNDLLKFMHEEGGCYQRMVTMLSQPDEPEALREQASLVGMTVAEHFQRTGHNVLILIESQLLHAAAAANLRQRLQAAGGAITLGIFDHNYNQPLDSPTTLGTLDTQIVLKRELAKQKIWPAIDPLASTSRLLNTPAINADHRQTLQQATATLQTNPGTAQSRRLQVFQSQPFFVAERYTAIPAAFVPLSETLRAVTAIVQGSYDSIPEEDFRFAGRIEDVLARAVFRDKLHG
jgi:F-type H+-transporting ATPase subunit beta